jgi:uncharacterized protein (TIGR03000 family)
MKAMFPRNTRVAIVAIGIVVLAGFATTMVFSQSSDTTALPGQGSSVVHNHTHYHYYAPTSALTYPSYANPTTTRALNARYPLPPNQVPPTQAHPYPRGYVPGQFAPLPFQNTLPNAPPDEGVIHVFLPAVEADVYLNGQQMKGSGSNRKYTTPPLQPNREFQYWVVARFERDGQKVTDHRKIFLGASEYAVADFTQPADALPYNPVTNTSVRMPAGPVNPNDVIPDTNRGGAESLE